VSESTITNEILNGSGLNLAAAARVFPPYRGSKPINPSTIFRWIMSGVRLPDGMLLHLEARRVGGRWLTSREAIQRFIDAQTPNRANGSASRAERTKNAARAGKELERAGF
jgi:hypothetical protein